MQVVILAGGLGTRLRSVAEDLPKSLVPVAGRPFIEHQLQLLEQGGLTDILICAGYKAEMIREHVGDGARQGVQIRYAREDPQALLGTGGALVHALPQLADRFMVLYGDSYLPTDYRQVTAAFERVSCPGMMCVYRNDGQWDKSNVRIDGSQVVFYSKAAKPGEADHIDYGLTALRRRVIEAYEKEPMPLDMATILENLVGRSELAAYLVAERFYEIGKPEGLAELDEYLSKRAANEN